MRRGTLSPWNKPRLYCGGEDPSEGMKDRAIEFMKRASHRTAFHKPIARHSSKVFIPGSTGEGMGLLWLECFRDFDEDRCILYPFRTSANPRGGLNYNFKRTTAPRVMCLMVHGAPKGDGRTMALHSCGNGHLGCVNPKHLYWGDQSDNSKDARRHEKEGKPVVSDDRLRRRIQKLTPQPYFERLRILA
jgi:hypothetical protein